MNKEEIEDVINFIRYHGIDTLRATFTSEELFTMIPNTIVEYIKKKVNGKNVIKGVMVGIPIHENEFAIGWSMVHPTEYLISKDVGILMALKRAVGKESLKEAPYSLNLYPLHFFKHRCFKYFKNRKLSNP